ncbi:MAG: O-antigen ligase family protein [Chloroflexi bacterium]|nr:O-antigen ligase family protein [Chloroflexota bacterium]
MAESPRPGHPSAPTTPHAQRAAGTLMACSHAAYAAFAVLTMLSPSWRESGIGGVSLARLVIGGHEYHASLVLILACLVAPLWLLARALRRDLRPRLGPAHIAIPVLGFGALILARIWPIHSVRTAFVAVVAVLLLWASYLYAAQDWPHRWLVGCLAAVLAVQGAVATLQFLRQSSVGLYWLGERHVTAAGQGISVVESAGRRWLRAYGLTLHPNILGGHLSLSLLVCLGVAIGRWRPRRDVWVCRSLLWVAMALGLLGLFFSFSRSAWLGTAVGLLYFALVTRLWQRVDWRSPRARRMAMFAAVASIVLLGILLGRYGGLLVTRFLQTDAPLEQASVRERLTDIGLAWGLVRDVPLLGVGPGYYEAALWASVGNKLGPGYPGFRIVHNIYLRAAAELGIPGGLLCIALTLSPVLAAARSARRGALRPDIAGLAAAFVASAIIGLFDSYLYIPVTWWPPVLIGMLSGSWARLVSLQGLEDRHALR